MRDNQQCNYLPEDGYTLAGYADGIPGFPDAVRFTYRPIGADLQARYSASIDRLQDTPTNPAKFRRQAEIAASHLRTWDLKDRSGKPLPINAKSLRDLHPQLFWKMFGIVFGNIPTDLDPEWEDDIADIESDIVQQSAVEGGTPGQVREANDEKNSD